MDVIVLGLWIQLPKPEVHGKLIKRPVLGTRVPYYQKSVLKTAAVPQEAV
jgi:hypothetical protein